MNRINRREFLGTAACWGTALSMNGLSRTGFARTASARTQGTAAPKAGYRTKLYKSFITEMPTAEECETAVEAGYEGLEATAWDVSLEEAAQGRHIAESAGLRIHSLMRGWAELNSDDPDVRAESVESIQKAVRVARAYGADTVLLVPCRVDNPGLNPWDFHIEFDPATCQVSRVTDGDNAPYQDYIDQQNIATERTFEMLQEVIPAAAYEGVTIALENVWNNLWVTPDFAAAFVRMFDSRWIRAYLDLGNNIVYAPAVEWVRALGGDLITKLHIKGYKFDEEAKKDPESGFCDLGYDNIDWVEVRNVMEEENVSAWISYEEPKFCTLTEYGVLLDDFVNGRPMVAPR